MSTAPEPTAGTIRVEVVYATPRKQLLLAVDMPQGCTVEQAIERSGIRREFEELKAGLPAVGIFSRKVALDRELRAGDRVELYRPLIADPKEARRKRAIKKK